MQAASSQTHANEFDIEALVTEATWKDVLLELVKKNELDPWGIDITDIVERYVDAVKRMKVLDLRVPANIILAAAILLRLKSELLQIEEQAGEETNGEPEVPMDYAQPGGITLRMRLQPKRRVTLDELIAALDEAMKLKEYKEEAAAPAAVPIHLEHTDIEAEIESVFSLVRSHADSSKMITYSTLCEIANKENALVSVFVPLLFLASKSNVLLIQETFFGEIVIVLNM